MTDDLVKRLRKADEYEPLGHDGWEAADIIEALIAERDALKSAQIEAIRAALEAAAEVAANEADYVPVRPEDFRKAIRALAPAAIAAKLKGEGDGVI